MLALSASGSTQLQSAVSTEPLPCARTRQADASDVVGIYFMVPIYVWKMKLHHLVYLCRHEGGAFGTYALRLYKKKIAVA